MLLLSLESYSKSISKSSPRTMSRKRGTRDSALATIGAALMNQAGPVLQGGVKKLLEGDLRSIQKLNAVLSIMLGMCCIFVPHRFVSRTTEYNHFAHEMIRLYGCVSWGLGYLVYWTRSIKDSRLMRATTEAFCVCYGLQALVICRAQFASPSGHSTLHWIIALLFAGFSGMYGVARFSKKLKDFDMLGTGQD